MKQTNVHGGGGYSKKLNNKNLVLTIILVVVLLVFVVGVTYTIALFTSTSNANTVNTGRISMSYTEPTNALVLENSLPMSDTEGKAQSKYFEFTVTSHATTNASDSTGITIPYEINISDISTTNEKIEKYFVKLNLVKVSGTTEEEVLAPTKITGLTSSSLRENATVVYNTSDTHKNGSSTITTKYRLRAWLDKDYAITNKNTTTYQYKFRVNVNSEVNALGINKEQEETAKYLSGAILEQGVVTTGDGLYKSNVTNTTQPTYFYRGNVEDNYLKLDGITNNTCKYNGNQVLILDTTTFNYAEPTTEEECTTMKVCKAPQDFGYFLMDETVCSQMGGTVLDDYAVWTENEEVLWRVVRVNEDGTIRLITDEGQFTSAFNPTYNSYEYMYYSNSNVEGGIKKTLNDWYEDNLSSYDSQIATSTYCEQAKVKYESRWTSGNATMEYYYANYTSNFKCEEDGNGYGLITDQKVGLISVDEAVHAGGIIHTTGQYYLANPNVPFFWTMSPAGFDDNGALVWLVASSGFFDDDHVYSNYFVRPVISLNADVLVTGLGTSDKPWVVQ